MKRVLSVLLTVVLLLSLIPAGAVEFAIAANAETEKQTEGYYTYKVGNGHAIITDVSSELSGDVIIPDSLGGYPVTSIGDMAFFSCLLLTSVSIPASVKSIGEFAFASCESLTSVTIPEGVTEISFCAFRDCYSLTSVTIPNGVTEIEGDAFCFCVSLSTVSIPRSIVRVEEGAFDECYSLTDVYYDGVEAAGADIVFGDRNGFFINATWHYTECAHDYGGDNLCDVCGEDKFLSYYTYTVSASKATITDVSESISGNIIIPSILGGYPVTRIGWEAFFRCSDITAITIPEGVTVIEGYTFFDCTSLTSVTIPDSVTHIGAHVFVRCGALEAITVGSGNTVYRSEGNCLIHTADKELIAGCKTSVIPTDGSVTRIGKDAFSDCTSLASVTIPDGVTSIGDSAFYGCTSLASVTIPASVTSIGGATFLLCNALNDVYYDGGEADRANIEIGVNNASLTNATWHYAVCFHENGSVKNAIVATCTADGYTGDTVCADCGETIKGEVIPATGHDYGDDNLCDVCGEDTMRDYYTATVTDGKLTITDVDTAISGKITIPAMIDGCPVVAIGNNAFRDCKNITSITIPESVETIGNYAFKDCTALTTVYYNAKNCTSAGVNAYPVFYGCTALTAAYIGKTVESVPPRLFREVTALTTVYLTKNTATIGANAFYLCGNLSSVHFVGTAGEFAAVDVKSYNTDLTNATFAYNALCFDGHDWTAECDELCEFCGATRVTVHTNVVEDAAKAPTCTETGLTAGSHCEACGNVFEKQNVIPALGHTWDEGTVTVEPTYEVSGYRQVTCTVCGDTGLLEIPPLTRAEVRDGYYYYDGVKVPNAGLVKIHNDYYYVLAGAKVKTGRYSVFNTNGLDIPSGIYYFFEDGRMNLAAGVYEGRYYNAQGLSEAYAGLVEVNGAKYYIQAGGNVTTGRYFISKLNGLLPKKRAYTFYPDGTMLEETRIYSDGFYYENGLRVPYAGMVQYEGHWYYVSDNAAYVKNKQQILVNVNNSGLAKNARCYFDENGHMVTNKVVNGKYYDETGAAPSYAGVVKAADGNLYYVSGTHGGLTANKTFSITAAKTNGLCAAGKYTADANGVLTPAA